MSSLCRTCPNRSPASTAMPTWLTTSATVGGIVVTSITSTRPAAAWPDTVARGAPTASPSFSDAKAVPNPAVDAGRPRPCSVIITAGAPVPKPPAAP